jgi:hypothetical protein
MKRDSGINYSDVPTLELMKGLDAMQQSLALHYLMKPTSDELDAEMQKGMYHSTMDCGLTTDELFDRHGFERLGRSIFRNDVWILEEDHNHRDLFISLKADYQQVTEPRYIYELMLRCLDENYEETLVAE